MYCMNACVSGNINRFYSIVLESIESSELRSAQYLLRELIYLDQLRSIVKMSSNSKQNNKN